MLKTIQMQDITGYKNHKIKVLTQDNDDKIVIKLIPDEYICFRNIKKGGIGTLHTDKDVLCALMELNVKDISAVKSFLLTYGYFSDSELPKGEYIDFNFESFEKSTNEIKAIALDINMYHDQRTMIEDGNDKSLDISEFKEFIINTLNAHMYCSPYAYVEDEHTKMSIIPDNLEALLYLEMVSMFTNDFACEPCCKLDCPDRGRYYMFRHRKERQHLCPDQKCRNIHNKRIFDAKHKKKGE